MGIYIHHMRGRMGSGETYARPEHHLRAEQEEMRFWGLRGEGLCEWLGREGRCGEQLGCGLSVQGTRRADPMEYAIRRGLVWPNEARGRRG